MHPSIHNTSSLSIIFAHFTTHSPINQPALSQKNMLHHPQPPATTTIENSDHPTTFHDMYSDEFDLDSNCSTPFVSAPSSPVRTPPPQIGGFYYSAPTSPVHFILSTSAQNSKNPSVSPHSEASPASSTCSFEFDFSARLTTNGPASPGSITTMTSADELFLNGQIRPMKLSDVLDDDPLDVDEISRGRAAKFRDRSRRRTRSMSPLRTMPFEWGDDYGDKIVEKDEENQKKMEKMNSRKLKMDGIENIENEGLDLDSNSTTTPNQCESGSSSRSSSVGRSSKKWVFLKEFLYRSKSEGRNNGHKFWGSLSFSPVKDKIKMEKFLASRTPSNVSSKDKIPTSSECSSVPEAKKGKQSSNGGKDVKKKTAAAAAGNGVGKRRVPRSAHELHYTANRAQAEEMRKKTFLPYRQGLLGCLGFSSKSYGAVNGFARALNPVSSS